MQPLLNYKQKTNFLSMLPTNMDEEGSPKIRSATAAGGNLIQDAKACSMLSCLELPTDWEEDLCVSRKCTLQRYSLLCWVPKWVFWLRHPCRECQLRRDILLKCLKGFPLHTSVSTVLSFVSHLVSFTLGLYGQHCPADGHRLRHTADPQDCNLDFGLRPSLSSLAYHPWAWLLPRSCAHPRLPCWEGQDPLLGGSGTVQSVQGSPDPELAAQDPAWGSIGPGTCCSLDLQMRRL